MISIMILEDEEDIRWSLGAWFEDYEYKVYQAENAELALKILHDKKVNVVIVDVRLPGIDGIEFVRQGINYNDYTVFIFHTGSPEFIFPQDLIDNTRVSKEVFYKPVTDLSKIYERVLLMIKGNNNFSDNQVDKTNL